MIKPLYNNVLLKKVEASNETQSGIIISQKEKNEEYAVVAAVSGCKEIGIYPGLLSDPFEDIGCSDAHS